MKNLCVTLLLSIAAFGQIRAKVQTAASGPSVSLTCTGPTSGTPANSFNFLSSLTNGGPYTLLGNVPTCAYTDTSQAFSTTVYYVAQSVNTATCPTGCVSGNSNQATAVIPANPVPNPPTGLTVGTIVANNVPLKWTAPKPQLGVTVNAYSVWRGVHPNLPSPTKVATVTATNYEDHPGVGTWYYETKAEDKVGNKTGVSSPSNIVEAVIR